MVYSNKFVMCVLLNGRPQEELANGVVKLPFGAEYELRFRNKNNRRAVVKIYVDGENVSGGGYIIPANDHVDIKRHWDKDRAFKFVELNSAEAVDAGKNGPNPDKSKGLIEAHFYLEKETKNYPWWNYRTEEHHHHHHHHDHYHPTPRPWNPIRPYYCSTNPQPQDDQYGATYSSGEIKVTCDNGGSGLEGIKLSDCSPAPSADVPQNSGAGGSSMRSREMKYKGRKDVKLGLCSVSPSSAAPATESASYTAKAPELKDGCTVEGDSTGQQFSTTWIDLEDSYTTLKVFLQGFEDDHVQHVEESPKKKRKTNKDSQIEDLESENERLRKELAELENEKLKKKLKKAKKKKDQGVTSEEGADA
jgi:hypothetical protein